MRLNVEEHTDFTVFKKPEVKKVEVDRKNMQVSILEARMQKMQYMKMRRKGSALEDDEYSKNLQAVNSSAYYSLDHLMSKLGDNDILKGKETVKEKTWRQLNEEEQTEKLIEFAEKFKLAMEAEVWKDLKKELLKHLKDGNFLTSNTVNWHKGTQKILEIPGLVINPSCFYWN